MCDTQPDQLARTAKPVIVQAQIKAQINDEIAPNTAPSTPLNHIPTPLLFAELKTRYAELLIIAHSPTATLRINSKPTTPDQFIDVVIKLTTPTALKPILANLLKNLLARTSKPS